MSTNDDLGYRPARPDEAEAVFRITQISIAGLGRQSYSARQIENWMGARTPAFYGDLIANGRMHVCERGGRLVGFVDSEPGEVTRLFLLPEVAGKGVGKRLLEIGIAEARKGHTGPIKVESTLNAEGFYKRHGFRRLALSTFTHGLGGDPIEVVVMELGER